MKVLICKYCGQLAGPASRCPVYSDDRHVFVEMEFPAFCKYCGQVAGIGSTCPVGSDERHVFVPNDD
jgi:RNA polymerase subunit RPABC4/transcription elongation factor Spt4